MGTPIRCRSVHHPFRSKRQSSQTAGSSSLSFSRQMNPLFPAIREAAITRPLRQCQPCRVPRSSLRRCKYRRRHSGRYTRCQIQPARCARNRRIRHPRRRVKCNLSGHREARSRFSHHARQADEGAVPVAGPWTHECEHSILLRDSDSNY